MVGGKATGSAGERAWEGVGKPRLQRVCSSLLKPAQPSCGGLKINSFDICPLENEKLKITRFEVEVSAKETPHHEHTFPSWRLWGPWGTDRGA